MIIETQIVLKNQWKVLPIVLLGPFVGSLNASIINIALPAIAKNFQIGMGEVQWVWICPALRKRNAEKVRD